MISTSKNLKSGKLEKKSDSVAVTQFQMGNYPYNGASVHKCKCTQPNPQFRYYTCKNSASPLCNPMWIVTTYLCSGSHFISKYTSPFSSPQTLHNAQTDLSRNSVVRRSPFRVLNTLKPSFLEGACKPS